MSFSMPWSLMWDKGLAYPAVAAALIARYALMNECWRKEQQDRPTFKQLKSRIAQLVSQLALNSLVSACCQLADEDFELAKP
jgi:hypothetical protein